MQLLQHHLLPLLFFLFLISRPIQAFVLPGFGDNHDAVSSQPSKYSIFPQWTWLRNTLIEKVVGPPPKVGKPVSNKPSTGPRPSSSRLPANLLAKYGGDVVLRFNLSTPEEEKALADVADTLFLDIWEFTNNWADIRLREDDVRLICYG
jgi:extracellular matrix protein 14